MADRQINVVDGGANSKAAQSAPLQIPTILSDQGAGFPFFPPLRTSSSTSSTSRRRGKKSSSSTTTRSSTSKPFAFPTSSSTITTTASSQQTSSPDFLAPTPKMTTLSSSTSAATAVSAGLGASVSPIAATSKSSGGGGGMSGGEIAAAVVVPVVVVGAAVIALVLFLLRRRKRRAYEEHNEPKVSTETSEAPQIPPLAIPRKAIPTGSQFGTGYQTRRQSTDLSTMPVLTEKEPATANATATNATSTAQPSVASSVRDPFETPYGSEGQGNGFLALAGEISPTNNADHRVSTIDENHAVRQTDELSDVSDVSYQDDDVEVAEVSTAQRASVIHMGSGNSPRGSTGNALDAE